MAGTVFEFACYKLAHSLISQLAYCFTVLANWLICRRELSTANHYIFRHRHQQRRANDRVHLPGVYFGRYKGQAA